MAQRRVFVVWANPIFRDSVRNLLRSPDVEWVGAASDHAAALEQIIQLQPDTILAEEAQRGDTPAEVVEIMEACSSDVRIIRLSLADNTLTLYRREQRTAADADDLLRLVRGNPPTGGAEAQT